MEQTTAHLLALWQEGRTRLAGVLAQITAADLPKKLPNTPNSIGFLLRHIADVELLFAKNVFGAQQVKVHATTVAKPHDTGEWTDLEALKTYLAEAAEALQSIIAAQPDSIWQETVTTREFGTKTKAEALGRITTHTAWHAGQVLMILKYGHVPS